MHYLKLKKGWAVRFYDDVGKQQYLSGYKTKKDAEKAAIDFKENQLHAVDRNITVKEYMLKWFDEYVELSVADRTKVRYAELILLHMVPIIGHHKLSNLKPAHIKTFYVDKIKSGELSPTTVLHIHRILNIALKHAVFGEYIKYNPCYAVTPPKKADTEIIIPTDTELKQILDLSKKYEPYMAIYIAAITGMRLSEIAALQCDDIDLGNKVINVRWNYQRIKGKYELCKLKTRTSKRPIAIITGTEKPLVQYIKQKNITKMQNRLTYQDNNFLLVHNDGSPFQGENISKIFKKIIRKLGLDDDMSFKSLRHYHATWLLRNNIHPKIVSERLGHSNVNITLNTYSHMLPDLQEDALRDINPDVFLNISMNI